MKDKKKLLLIGGIILVLVLGIVLYLIFSNTDKNNSSNNDNTGGKVAAPANNTEELVKEMKVMEIKAVTKDEIVFSNDIEIKENEKVAVWIYSEPKFLGYFDVLVENGTKKIVGLKEAIEKITIEDGEHNIAITTESGKPLGYVDVRIENNGSLRETTTKRITETETIKYSTTKQNEANMKKGKTSVVQPGDNGSKEIIYDVTYDSNGKEISRKIISEKITKEAVNEIIKVGTSDFNIKSDKTFGIMFGPACPESKTITNGGAIHCNDEKYADLEQFGAYEMEDKIIVTSINNKKISKAIIATPVKENVFVGTYNGQKYYFDGRMGDGEPGTLTSDFCKEYGLSCSAW